MKRSARFVSLVLAVILCLSVLPLSAAADGADTGKNGWVYEAGLWFYHDHGQVVYGWRKIGGVWYYFEDAHGYMYFNQWLCDPDTDYWYHFASNGAMETNRWIQKTTYDDQTLPQPHTSWYYLTSSGRAASGWLKIGGKWYYFRPDGERWEQYAMMSKEWLYSDGCWYYFNKSGAMATNQWVRDTGSNGSVRWFYQLGSGKGASGWQKIDGNWYYFDPYSLCVMLTGLQKIDGKWYFFRDSGAMLTGWKKIPFGDENGDTWDEWMYFTSSGAAAEGWKKIDGVWYYFVPEWDDVMITDGPWKIDGKWYFFRDSGALYTGWKKVDGLWMYFTSAGAYVNTTKQIDGKWYTFDSNGFLVE